MQALERTGESRPVPAIHPSHTDIAVLIYTSPGDFEDWGSKWMILTRNEDFMKLYRVRKAMRLESRERKGVRLWTDDFSSPFQLLEE